MAFLLDNAVKFAEDRSVVTFTVRTSEECSVGRIYRRNDSQILQVLLTERSLRIEIVNGRSEWIHPPYANLLLEPFSRCMEDTHSAKFSGE